MSHIDYASRTFGFDPQRPQRPKPARLPLPEQGEILVVTGPSGAGKSLALSALASPGSREITHLRSEDLATPVLDLFDPGSPSEEVLRTLARVGLADGRLWRMHAGDLSAGECRRLELALAICGAGPGTLLVADEFDAHLDATSARVLAQNLRGIAVRRKLRVAASTHREEVLPLLAPSRLFAIASGKAAELPPPEPADLGDAIEIVAGRVRDYDAFAHWHYMGPGRPGPSSDVWLAKYEGEPVGIAMFGYPHLLLGARAKALPRYSPARIRSDGARGLNADVRLLQRVVVDPRFRGIGVSRRLIRHGLEHAGVPHVECVAQMGAFSDFLLAAGFRRVCEVPPPKAARRLSDFCRVQGISPQALLDGNARRLLLAYLPEPASATLQRLLDKLVQSRIETGNGWRRGHSGADREPLLRKALARLCACPAYFLWTDGGKP
ncbi:MAG: hypothetical protein H6839_15635 [Planctomycetes bacterium]|nr:hypothetical protein [Planctomycetota bacterium]